MGAKVKLFDETEACKIYSIQFAASDKMELEKFMEKFINELKYRDDYNIIIASIAKIFKLGAKERYFRPEGKFGDRVCALPIDKACLRLYCIRLSDNILIIGNGGVKDTATYQEKDELRGYVLTLQTLDKLIKNCEDSGSIKVTEVEIEYIDNINFEL